MKKILLFIAAFSALFLFSCKNPAQTPDSDSTLKILAVLASGEEDIEVTAENAETYGVKFETGKITFTIPETVKKYTLSGSYTGQLCNEVKGTVFNLNGVTLENTDAPAFYGKLKFELSAKKDTENSISITGDYDKENKCAAVHCEKAIEIGGKGKLFISGKKCHGVKGGDITLKGSGEYTFEGSNEGSAINCNTFTVDEGESFTATLQNAKNGIKADETIDIASGTFYFKNLSTALKTDEDKDDPEVTHYINITGGTFYKNNVKKEYSTEDTNSSIPENLFQNE